jgi:hypothetical protein
MGWNGSEEIPIHCTMGKLMRCKKKVTGVDLTLQEDVTIGVPD